jgi:hypothetical protein
MYTIVILALLHLSITNTSGVLDGQYIHEGTFADLAACEAERQALEVRLPQTAIGVNPPAVSWLTFCVRK